MFKYCLKCWQLGKISRNAKFCQNFHLKTSNNHWTSTFSCKNMLNFLRAFLNNFESNQAHNWNVPIVNTSDNLIRWHFRFHHWIWINLNRSNAQFTIQLYSNFCVSFLTISNRVSNLADMKYAFKWRYELGVVGRLFFITLNWITKVVQFEWKCLCVP